MASCGLSYYIPDTYNDFVKNDETKLEPAITELVLYPFINDPNNGENNNSSGNNGNQGNSSSVNMKNKNYNKSALTQMFEISTDSKFNNQSVRRQELCQEVRNVIYMEHKKYTILARVSTDSISVRAM
jgi:hypothetical protein